MRVWRICHERHVSTALSGEGAKLSGGRWNKKGDPVIYTAEALSLAALELFVHIGSEVAPRGLVALPVEVPDDLPRTEWTASDLPRDWRRYPAPARLQASGSAWLRSLNTALLFVPSAVLPEERNVLINPRHEDARTLVLGEARPFAFDPRMWR